MTRRPPYPPPAGPGQRGDSGPADVDAHPRPGLDDRERELAPAVVTAWRIVAALYWLVPAVGVAVAGFVFTGAWGWLVLITLVSVLAVRIGVYPPLAFGHWRWQLTDLALELRHGVLVQHQQTVPYFRIQQIDVVHNPIDRWLGLSSLRVTSATIIGTVKIPGMAADEAPVVRAELLARAAQAVAEHPGDLGDAV